MKNKLELLAPAGNLEKLKYALEYGADAVYFGLPNFSLRYRINKFGYREMAEGIKLARTLKKKVYVTINIFPHEEHLKLLPAHLKKLKLLKPDALIISDPGILSIVRKTWPKIAIHLSTQANCTNSAAAKFWFEQGVSRIILARETTLLEIKKIHATVPKMELEYFVHGAMCMAYSGRCILSKWFTDRSANLGDCTQPCRWEYHLKNSTLALEETERPENFFPIEEDKHGTYIMNSKDLCLLEHLGALTRAGITSFKIEGRAKSLYYLANTVKVYRTAIDDLTKHKKFNIKLLEEIQKTPNRGFTTGFLFGEKNVEQRFDSSHDTCDYEFCGEVKKYNPENHAVTVRVHNTLKVGDQIEVLEPKKENIQLKIKQILNKKNESISEAHGGQNLEVFIPVTTEITVGALLRRRK